MPLYAYDAGHPLEILENRGQLQMDELELRTQLGQFGITPEQMFEQMHGTLERMKSQLDLPPS